MQSIQTFYKQGILAIIIILISGWGWYSLKTRSLPEAILAEIGKIVLIFLLIFGILFIFCALFIKKKKNFLFLTAILTLLPLLFFEKTIALLIASVVFFLLLWRARQNIRKNKKESIKFSFWKITSRGLALSLIGLSLVLIIVLTFSPFGQQLRREVPRPLFNQAIELSVRLINLRIPGFYKDISVDDFLRITIASQAKESPELINLPKEDIKQKLEKIVTPEIIEQGREELAKHLNVEIGEEAKLKDILYNFINKKFLEYSYRYERYLPFILILIGLVVMKFFILFLRPIILFLSWSIFKILKILKVIKIKQKMVKKEIITL